MSELETTKQNDGKIKKETEQEKKIESSWHEMIRKHIINTNSTVNTNSLTRFWQFALLTFLIVPNQPIQNI